MSSRLDRTHRSVVSLLKAAGSTAKPVRRTQGKRRSSGRLPRTTQSVLSVRQINDSVLLTPPSTNTRRKARGRSHVRPTIPTNAEKRLATAAPVEVTPVKVLSPSPFASHRSDRGQSLRRSRQINLADTVEPLPDFSPFVDSASAGSDTRRSVSSRRRQPPRFELHSPLFHESSASLASEHGGVSRSPGLVLLEESKHSEESVVDEQDSLHGKYKQSRAPTLSAAKRAVQKSVVPRHELGVVPSSPPQTLGSAQTTSVRHNAGRRETAPGVRHQRSLSGQSPCLPRSLVKAVFSHFAGMTVSHDGLDAVMNSLMLYQKRFAGDLAAYAEHAGRLTITKEDVEVHLRRLGLVTRRRSLTSLITRHLPVHLVQQLVPVAKAHNRVVPER